MQKLLCLVLLLVPLILSAQPDEAALNPAVSDSLTQERERQIESEYDFTDSNTLLFVATNMGIKDLAGWKRALGLEPANHVLDDMPLKRLEITPYRAFLAQQTVLYGFNELNTLSEIAASLNMPLKKLKAMLGNDDPLDKSWDNMSIQALGIDLDTVTRTREEFAEGIVLYGSSVTLVGMLVVFSALVLTSLIISQLVHLNREKTSARTISLSSDKKLKNAPKSISCNVIAAAITALHIHEMELEERRKMVLTFRRTPTNQWRASAVLSMPNREMNSSRRK
jgi:hypothetical protein